MKATQQLKNEHQGVKVMLSVMNKISQQATSGVDNNEIEQILEFFKVFVDACHHSKEEDFLFPALTSSQSRILIGQLLEEHQQGRDLIKQFNKVWQNYLTGNQLALTQIASTVASYHQLLTSHIDKEDNVLFPQADRELSPEKQQELYGFFEKLEEEKIGLGRHEQFHKLLENLSKKYLS